MHINFVDKDVMLVVFVVVVVVFFFSRLKKGGGSVSEWLERWTCNSEAPSSSRVLTAS